MNTIFRIICTTDKYNASRHAGFDHNGMKVIDTYNSLKEANAAMLTLACDAYGRYFANWGLVCAARNIISSAGTHADGCRYFSEDIYNYAVEEVEV